MKSFNPSSIVVRACAAVAFLIMTSSAMMAQPPSHTAKISPVIDANINGFWEYLPRNYGSDINQRYPLIIFLHGNGDTGSQTDTATLNKVLRVGTPKIIKSGGFPDSFNVAGKWHKFIVISPQIKDGYTITPNGLNALIDYATAAYRVDNSRIYLCGLSMGGGLTWSFAGGSEAAAGKLAAIVVAAGTAVLDTAETDNIAEAFLPVLATHNILDEVVPVTNTIGNINKVKKSKDKVKNKNKPNKPALDPDPLIFLWDSPGLDEGNILDNHNVWSRTFEDIQPGITLGGNLRDLLGYNVYEWMLQYTRTAAGPLPVTWESFTVTEINKTALLRWTTTRELNLKSYIVEKSNDGINWSQIATLPPLQSNSQVKEYSFVDNQPFPEINYYRIKQLDVDEKFTYSAIKKFAGNGVSTVKIFPNPFDDQISLNFSGAPGASTVIVKLIDSRGAILRKEKLILQPGNALISLKNLHGLTAGFYYITVTNDQGIVLVTEKIVRK